MKITWNVTGRMLFFLLLSEVVFCDIERRLVDGKIVRDMTRKFNRFGSLERIRLRSYRSIELRKFPLISDSTIQLNEAGTMIKTTPQNFNFLNLNRINPTQGRISGLRLGGPRIGKRQRELSSKLRNVIAKTDLSNLDLVTEKSQNKFTQLTRGINKNDRRVRNEIENRFSPQIRENRLRENLRSRRSIVPPKYNTERRMMMIQTRNTDYKNLPPVILNESSEIKKPLFRWKKDYALTLLRLASNRRDAINQRSDKRETIQTKRRQNTRSPRRISKLPASFPEEDFLRKQPEVRRERNSLVSRRELKIPDSERMRSESKSHVRSKVVRGNNIEETIQNRRNGRRFRVRVGKRNEMETTENTRNGRGFRGRFEKRNEVETTQNRRNARGFRGRFEKRDVMNERRVSVNQRNQRIESSDRRKIFMKDTKRFSMYHVPKVSMYRHFSLSRIENLLSDFRNTQISRVKKDIDQRINQNTEAQRIRETRNGGNRERSIISPRTRRFTMRIENSRMERNFLRNERRNLPYHHLTQWFTLVGDSIKQDASLSQKREQNKAAQKRTNLRTSDRNINNKERLVTNSVNSVLPSRFSMLEIDQRVLEKGDKFRNRVVRSRRMDNRMRFITRRDHSKSVMGFVVAPFSDQISQANEFNRNSRNIDRKSQSAYSRGVSMRTRREMVDKYRDNSRKYPLEMQRRTTRLTHRNMKMLINSIRYVKIESATTRNRNDFRKHDTSRSRITSNFSTVSASVSKPNAFIQSINTSKELYAPTNLKIIDFRNKMSFSKNSVRLLESQRTELHALTHLIQERWTLYEYVFQKKSCIISFVFNTILGLAVIVAMSEDINKGFFSQLKNQFQHSILKYLKVG